MSVQQDDPHQGRPGRPPRPAPATAHRDLSELCRCSTTSLRSPTGEATVLRVAGEVDVSSLAVLRTALTAALDRHADHVVVDLAELRFCSVRGLTVLAEAGATAAGLGIEYAIGGAPRQANRVWALGWADTELPMRFPTAGDGVLAALAHQSERPDAVRSGAAWAPEHLRPGAPGRPGDATDAAQCPD